MSSAVDYGSSDNEVLSCLTPCHDCAQCMKERLTKNIHIKLCKSCDHLFTQSGCGVKEKSEKIYLRNLTSAKLKSILDFLIFKSFIYEVCVYL